MIIYQAGRINQFILIISKAAEPTVCRQNEGRASYRPDYFFKKKAIPTKGIALRYIVTHSSSF